MLQFGTILLLMTAFVVPALEWFDRWDSPGLLNDSEYRVFALVLVVCLVLLVSRLIVARALLVRLLAEWGDCWLSPGLIWLGSSVGLGEGEAWGPLFAVPPLLVLPLRI